MRRHSCNSRLDEIQAAVLSVKLPYLDKDNERCVRVANRYINGIKNPRILLPEKAVEGNHVYHILPVRCERRDILQAYLRDCGIQTVIHYLVSRHRQKAYQEWDGKSYPITEAIHEQELSLPMSSVLTDEQVEYVVQTVNRWKG